MMEPIHMGKEVKKVMKSRGLSNRAIAKLVGLKHSSINYTIAQTHVKTELLLRLGEVLQYNFFELYVPQRQEREQRIAELEEQVADLQKQLAEKELAMRAKEAEAMLRENELLKKVLKLE